MIRTLLPNPVKTKLKSGQACYGVMVVEFYSPGLCQIAASAGVDFLIFDMEASGAGLDQIKSQIAYARGTGVVPLVRVAGLARHLVATALDAGAMGIMAPTIESREQAELLVSWCRYPPEGSRGLAFGISHDDYTTGDPREKMSLENERTLVIPTIESAKGIENIAEILSVPGIDVAQLGYLDLTATYGIVGDYQSPIFLDALNRLVAAAKLQNVTLGCSGSNRGPFQLSSLYDLGFRFLLIGADVHLLKQAMAEQMSLVPKE